MCTLCKVVEHYQRMHDYKVPSFVDDMYIYRKYTKPFNNSNSRIISSILTTSHAIFLKFFQFSFYYIFDYFVCSSLVLSSDLRGIPQIEILRNTIKVFILSTAFELLEFSWGTSR